MRGFIVLIRSFCLVVASRWGVYVLMILGLCMAYATAMTISLYVRDEFTYDRFLNDTERLYLLSGRYGPVGQPLITSDVAPAGMARWIGHERGDIEAVSRLVPVEWPLSSDRRSVKERFYWADENIFDLLKLPVLKGDLNRALSKPGTIVMTERMARAYFGHADVVGSYLFSKGGMPLEVKAILQDFPSNTHLDREIFVSGKADYTMLSVLDGNPKYLWPTSYTYIRLRPATSVTMVERNLLELSRTHWQGPNNIPVGFRLIPLTDLHFQPQGDGQMKPRGHLNSVYTMMVVAVAVLLLAGINCAGLILAEAHERGREMALYASLGATRWRQMSYILREALVVNLMSAGMGLALVERVLPLINAELGIRLALWKSPVLELGGIAAAALFMGAMCGAYPAARITRFVISGAQDKSGGLSSDRWRGWVTAQLVLVITLLIITHTMARQWDYATRDALNFNGDDVVMVRFDEKEISRAFSTQIRYLEGVDVVAESFGIPTTTFVRPGWIRKPDGSLVSFMRNSVHPDFFSVYQVPILAGENLRGTFRDPENPRDILINEAAVRALGYDSLQQALGQTIEYETDRTRFRSRIIGVVPNLRFSTVYEPSHPMIFDNFSKYFTQVNVRLTPENQSRTLARIDALWAEVAGGSVPVERIFYQEYQQEQYHDMNQQVRTFGLVSAVAMLLSILGLSGLSIFLTRHQMREVAIRRALGARFREIFLLRLYPFILPLILANLIAGGLAWVILEIWLESFAARVDLSAASFLISGVLASGIALATLSAHVALTIRRAPMRILRQE